ncbi:MAG: hypothetical protein QOG43_475 [Actinomycetota bacterium]|nr:hypothetical protein [Actinomycetota bacterium]
MTRGDGWGPSRAGESEVAGAPRRLRSRPESRTSEMLARPSRARIVVAVVMRKPLPGQFSVERVFRDIVGALPSDIDASLVEVPCPSRGVLPRLRNMLFTARIQADVVHVAGDIQYCALAVRPSRCVLTVLDLVSVRRLRGWRRRVLFLVWYRAPVRFAAAVTTISAAVRAELLLHLPKAADKTVVIACPVGDHFQPAPSTRADHGLFRVLQVGTGSNKNLERVAAALEGLPVHLYVIGTPTGKQRHDMDRMGLSYSQAQDLSDSEMAAAYQQSSLLAFVSTYEGFGLPILEAQACGIPVVTSDIPPMCDVAGGAGILVNPQDKASIRRGVELAIGDTNLRLTLSKTGLLNAAQYTPTRIAGQYADTYRRILNRRLSGSGKRI